MTERAVVGILGTRVPSRAAVGLGYGLRELDVYPTSCFQPLLDAGLLHLGIPSADAGGTQCSDLVSGLVVLDGERGQTDSGNAAVPLVVDAISRKMPVLAICSGEALLAAAVERLPGTASRPTGAVASSLDSAAVAEEAAPADLAAELGLRASWPPLVTDGPVSPGLRPVVIAADGSVYASALDGGGAALAVRWEPCRLSPGHPARDGPFDWLKRHIAEAGSSRRNEARVGAARRGKK